MATNPPKEPLAIGWTTFEKLEDAQNCAKALVKENLAFCVQVESPVQSFYRWEGKVEDGREYPVRVKHVAAMDGKIQEWLEKNIRMKHHNGSQLKLAPSFRNTILGRSKISSSPREAA